MFRNRALKVTVFKDTDAVAPACNHLDPEQMTIIAKDVIVTIGSVVAAVKILDTLNKIAVIAAKAKIR